MANQIPLVLPGFEILGVASTGNWSKLTEFKGHCESGALLAPRDGYLAVEGCRGWGALGNGEGVE